MDRFMPNKVSSNLYNLLISERKDKRYYKFYLSDK